MESIKAEDNLAVESGDGWWRLLHTQSGSRVLLEASSYDHALSYLSAFAQARHLPSDGLLHTDIKEVVVGWSSQDRAWHLGLLLAEEPAAERGGRWCELARWTDDSASDKVDDVKRVGLALAQTTGCKFRFVRAHEHSSGARVQSQRWAETEVVRDPVQEGRSTVTSAKSSSHGRMNDAVSQVNGIQRSPMDAQAVPDLSNVAGDDQPVPALKVRRSVDVPVVLPIDLGQWRLRPIDIGLQWEHTRAWSFETIWGSFYRVVLGIVFVFLSVLTIQSPYAAVRPEILPFLGILVGIGLIIAGFRLLRGMLRTQSVVVDKPASQVRFHLDLTSDVRQQYGFSEIKAVVVTQFAQQKQPDRNGGPERMTHEAWLHLLLHEPRQEPGKERNLKPEDAYIPVGHIELTEGEVTPAHFEGKKRHRVPRILHADEATTPVQQAGILLARSIGVDAYLDQR